MTMSEAIKARAEATGYSADWSEYAHAVRVEQTGLCGGCDHCCDVCLNDGHHCGVCDDVVGHRHSHEEDE